MKNKPMLAYPVSKKPIDYSKPVFMQPKLDGVRCLIQYDKKYGVKAYSRTGKERKNINHILEILEQFFLNNPNILSLLKNILLLSWPNWWSVKSS